jgi:orotate phosphoribosyltransferase
MSLPTASDFLALVSGRHGHFRMESGYHSDLWLDLNDLFTDSWRVAPFVEALAARLRPYDAAAVCGPLLGGAFLAQAVARALAAEFWYTTPVPRDATEGLYQAQYALPASLVRRARGRRVAMVDDVMSAGSSLRATYAELQRQGARPVVAGALLLLGGVGEEYFALHKVAVEAVSREAYTMWRPEECPMCAAGIPCVDASVSS